MQSGLSGDGTTGEGEFWCHYSVTPIRYRVMGTDKDGFVIVADDLGNTRTMHPKIIAGLMRGKTE